MDHPMETGMDNAPGIVNNSSPIRPKTKFTVTGKRIEWFMHLIDSLGGIEKATPEKIVIAMNKMHTKVDEDRMMSSVEVMRYLRLVRLLSFNSENQLSPSPASPLSLPGWNMDRLSRLRAAVTKLGGVGVAKPEAITEEMRKGNECDRDVNLEDVKRYLCALRPIFRRTTTTNIGGGVRLFDRSRPSVINRGLSGSGSRSSGRRVIDLAEGSGDSGGFGPMRRRSRRRIESSSSYKNVLDNLGGLTL